ncbi:MAG: TetR/AcrR family transcriptional regulator, partial [Pseudolabrys sp.]
MNSATTQRQPDARTRLLDTAMQVIRAKGYTASTVDDICEAAGLTKGAFFHHFKSKEDLAVAAAAHFSQMAERLFGDASYRRLADPLDRLFGYIDFRTAILAGPLPQFTCLLGTMVQEAYDTHPAIR